MSKNTARKRGSGDSHFASLPSVNIRRSVFNRSTGYKTAFNEGQLIPFYIDEVLPGDTFKGRCNVFGRLSTPIVPFMDNLNLEVRFFYVPSRLLWNHWEEMNGAQEDPNSSTEYEVPYFTTSGNGAQVGSLADYFGIPINKAGLEVNALPFRAYKLIFNEWFRDENLQASLDWSKDDTGEDDTAFMPVKINKYHDYFTSALPWPQKGNSVGIPVLGSAPVTGMINTRVGSDTYLDVLAVPNSDLVGSAYGKLAGINLSEETVLSDLKSSSPLIRNSDYLLGVRTNTSGSQCVGKYIQARLGAGTNLGIQAVTLSADLTNATAGNINDLRLAFQTQKLFETDARCGTRYTEVLRAHFGVVSPDARLQRPEYLGGFVSQINVNSVAQTSATGDTTPQGNLAAYGLVADSKFAFNKSFVEHGYLIGLVDVRADLTYQQGLNRLWSRRSRFDFYWPVFAHLGEQAILNKEIYAQGKDVKDSQGNVIDDQVFGYQERYAEYRYCPSKITGALRSTANESLDVWHLGQNFASLPTLSSEFIEENAPLNRVLAVQNEPQILFDSWLQLSCVRPMPTYSVPGLIDHF